MITTIYKVKLILDNQNGVSASQPDASFDEDSGYYVGYILLVKDGTVWVCGDATAGAAVWTQDTDKDLQITEGVRTVTELIPRYCNHQWISADYLRLAGVTFADDTLTYVGAGFDDVFYAGDTLWVYGSKRNDGVFDVTSADDDAVVVSPYFNLNMTDSDTITVLSAVYPAPVQEIAARMVWYDVFIRANRTPGVDSEGIGSYSYSKSALVGGVEYPQDLIAGLALYKRPKVV